MASEGPGIISLACLMQHQKRIFFSSLHHRTVQTRSVVYLMASEGPGIINLACLMQHQKRIFFSALHHRTNKMDKTNAGIHIVIKTFV